jgi:hypothetical protein
MTQHPTIEHQRLAESEARRADWKRWGPYVAERAWGTVREDYSADGDAWNNFPHAHARSRTYRWNEDGLGGFCNRYQNVCLAWAFWNEHDPFLKERLFGLSGPDGNHGEDVKEYYFYLDSTPTHSYCKMLYKYPQVEFPYAQLVDETRQRGRDVGELELIDVLGDAFRQQRYFDIFIEYAKVDEEDILCRVTAVNRGPDPAPLHLLPHLWYRNTWSWGYKPEHPVIKQIGPGAAHTNHGHLGDRYWYASDGSTAPPLLFTENDTNHLRLYNTPNEAAYVKDAFHDAIVHGQADAVNPAGEGSKAAAHFQRVLQPGETYTVWTRFAHAPHTEPFSGAKAIMDMRISEADQFYAQVQPADLTPDERLVQRQAFAGLMWGKQFYHYSVELWLKGDPSGPPPPAAREGGRNHDWPHLYNLDVLSMPDKWEYPWYASWDLAFHTLPIALIDPEWAKRQLVLLLREWYMHPGGMVPAYEWNFSDVNPPVHAWACWRVYKIARNVTGYADTDFLEEVFQKLLLNFTWWVNRKDLSGQNIFQGGFLGLDNIGVFDRSKPLPGDGVLEQADGTAWMGMYCLNMMAIALELALTRRSYEAVATKFFEHFVYIADAINAQHENSGLWDPVDGFYYDRLRMPDGHSHMMRLRSIVGLIPLFAVETFDLRHMDTLSHFRRRTQWFLKYRPTLVAGIESLTNPREDGRRILSLVSRDKLERILPRVFDSAQFLSDYGVRSLSRGHLREPYKFDCDGQQLSVSYEPAESSSFMFGGNSNWRGPVWFPMNFLLIEALQKYDHYYGRSLLVEYPRYSGKQLSLSEVSLDLSRRLTSIFLRSGDKDGRRPVFGDCEYFQQDPQWRDYVPFYEYFHGDNGSGLGASHQTGWTALVAKLLQQCGGQ